MKEGTVVRYRRAVKRGKGRGYRFKTMSGEYLGDSNGQALIRTAGGPVIRVYREMIEAAPDA